MVFHVLNRANAQKRLFVTEADFAPFERVMRETRARKAMWIPGDLIMPGEAAGSGMHSKLRSISLPPLKARSPQ
jgi:hypothetical protein